MLSRWRGDRGGSAIEAALLIAAVALVMLPALFFLGRAVEDAFSKPCDEKPDLACASRPGSDGSDGDSAGGNGSLGNEVSDESPPDDLDDRVTNQLSSDGAESTVCDGPVTVSPPTRSTVCRVTYADSRPVQAYRVVWTEGSDDITLSEL